MPHLRSRRGRSFLVLLGVLVATLAAPPASTWEAPEAPDLPCPVTDGPCWSRYVMDEVRELIRSEPPACRPDIRTLPPQCHGGGSLTPFEHDFVGVIERHVVGPSQDCSGYDVNEFGGGGSNLLGSHAFTWLWQWEYACMSNLVLGGSPRTRYPGWTSWGYTPHGGAPAYLGAAWFSWDCFMHSEAGFSPPSAIGYGGGSFPGGTLCAKRGDASAPHLLNGTGGFITGYVAVPEYVTETSARFLLYGFWEQS